MLAHGWLWLFIALVFCPSFLLHCGLLFLTARERRFKALYNSLFYRLFVVQGILELVLLIIYLVFKLLVKERLAGDEIIMSLNNGFFPKFYYYGTIYYFFTVWGVIVQSIGRFLFVCAPHSKWKRRLDSIPDLGWILINTIVPFAVLFRQIFQGPVYFIIDKDRHAGIFNPPLVSHSNATQSMITTMGATIISAVFNGLVLRQLIMFRKELNCIRKHRVDIQLGLVGCIHFLAQCLMAAFHLTVMCSLDNQPFANLIRELYMIPSVLLTFVNPWMLLITDKNLRTLLFGLW